MNVYLHSLFLCLFLLLIGCSHKPANPLARVWFYNDSQTNQQQHQNAEEYGAHENYELSAAHFIDLHADSTYTCFLPNFDSGRWLFANDNLVLVNHSRHVVELTVKKADEHELVCLNKAGTIVYRFNGFEHADYTPANDPFSLPNNQWRMKASHKESERELAARLNNHFKYWEKFFAWGQKANINSLDYSLTPGPLKLFGNGFKLEYLNDELPEWKNSFYDTSDCRKAYEKLYYLLIQKDIRWPKTKDRCERFVSAFQQLQNWVK